MEHSQHEREEVGHGTRYDTGPTVAVVVGDYRAAWNGGVFSGDAPLVEWAETMAATGSDMVVYGRAVQADAGSPLGALAAMASMLPGRVVITAAPEEVFAAIEREEFMVAAHLEGDTNDEENT